MSETLNRIPYESRQPVESFADTAEAYQVVDFLTSDDLLEQKVESAKAELASPALAELTGIDEEIAQLTGEFNKTDDVLTQRELNSQIVALNNKEQAQPDSDKNRHDKAITTIKTIEDFGILQVERGSPEASKLLELIASSEESDNNAPFAEHAQNNSEVWKHVPAEDIDEYLDKKLYFNTSEGMSREDRYKKQIVVSSRTGEEIEVPIDTIVSLAGFDSWHGRSGGKTIDGDYQDDYDGEVASKDVVKHYASLPTEIPPVSTIRLYVQPNGVIFGDNLNGDSHRVAAAILRGDKTIKARNVSFQSVDINYLEPK